MLNVDEPYKDADDGYYFRKHITKIVELLLKGSWLRYLGDNTLVDIPNSRVAAGENHNSVCMTVHNGRAREQHVDLILFHRLGILYDPDILVHALAFASQY